MFLLYYPINITYIIKLKSFTIIHLILKTNFTKMLDKTSLRPRRDKKDCVRVIFNKV